MPMCVHGSCRQAAMGYKLTAPVERVQFVASSIDDRVFGALRTAVRHPP